MHCKLGISGGLDEERSLQTKTEYMRRISCSHFGCCCPIEKFEDHLRGITRDLRTGVPKSNGVDGGIFEHLLRTATNLSLNIKLQ